MHSRIWGRAFCALALVVLQSAAIGAQGSSAVESPLAKLPLAFEENHGQAPLDTRFIARVPGYQVHISSNALAMALTKEDSRESVEASVLRLRFEGARSDAEGVGLQPLQSTSNYFLGPNADQQFTDIPNYARVEFENVYPGIALAYYGNQRQLEYDIIVKPGADPESVRLTIDGADRVSINKEGDLQLAVGTAAIEFKHPVVYQEANGRRTPVAARFKTIGRNAIGIQVAAYDHNRTLTIDPTLVYSSFLGGTGDDHSRGVAVDASGNMYLTGYTFSSNFPMLSAYQSRYKPGPQAYVTKVNANGTALVYSTYLGDQSSANYAHGIAVDSSGDAYVTGISQGTTFPTTSGAYQTTSSGGANNSFVAKLGPAGNTLLFGTYVRNASALAIALDGNGNPYITGSAASTYATTTGAYKTASTSGGAFILKLSSDGKTALYSTFLGGSSGGDIGNAIAVDASGNAYIGGYAASTDFPATTTLPSPPQHGGHAFVTKLNAQGSALVYSDLLAGEDYDEAFGVAVDASGNAYATGETTSFTFPVSSNAFQKTKGGANTRCQVIIGSRYYNNWPNGFVTKISTDGSALAYSSFLGGSAAPSGSNCDGDYGAAIALDSSGHAFVAGNVQSTIGFPSTGDLKTGQPVDNDGFFVAKIAALGDAVLYSTHIGWQVSYTKWAVDRPPFAVAVDAKGDAYATTSSSYWDATADSFLISTGAYRTTPPTGSNQEVIFLKLTTGSALVASLNTSATSVDVGQRVTVSMTVAYAPGGSGGALTGSVMIFDGTQLLASVPLSNGAATTTLSLPIGVHGLSAVYRNNGAEAVSSPTYVAVNQPATCN